MKQILFIHQLFDSSSIRGHEKGLFDRGKANVHTVSASQTKACAATGVDGIVSKFD